MSIIGDFSCSEFERDMVGVEPIDDVLGRILSESNFLLPASDELSYGSQMINIYSTTR